MASESEKIIEKCLGELITVFERYKGTVSRQCAIFNMYNQDMCEEARLKINLCKKTLSDVRRARLNQ